MVPGIGRLGSAVVRRGHRVQIRGPCGQQQAAGGAPFQVGLETLDLRGCCVLYDRHAVGSEVEELEVVPVLEEQGAVPAHLVIVPLRLPANFPVGEKIGLVGREDGFDLRVEDAVDAARSEAGGVGEVHEPVAVELVCERSAIGSAVVGDRLVEVGARRAVERRRIAGDADVLAREEQGLILVGAGITVEAFQ